MSRCVYILLDPVMFLNEERGRREGEGKTERQKGTYSKRGKSESEIECSQSIRSKY